MKKTDSENTNPNKKTDYDPKSAESRKSQHFYERAKEWFGDDVDKFMQDVYRYADYINSNEPLLLLYVQLPFGIILLHEWMKRMDNSELSKLWSEMNEKQKDGVLCNFYHQIHQTVQSVETKKEHDNHTNKSNVN
ncbi:MULTISPECIES: hypothetical protein [unclassified Fibrobacter]|uniref:hypothetical protein n=1 Tax=unclassified Fibrobacter TaxID=2634177 RepID=UPI0025C60F92|nr:MULTISPECIES: hypothetical protein [unclassified Fibrobacter]